VGYEMDDVEFAINGKPFAALADVIPLKFIDGDLLQVQKKELVTSFTLSVKPLSDATRKLDYIALRVMSLCEHDLWENSNFNREPVGHTTPMREMTWSQRCPQVEFDGSTMADYSFSSVSPASGPLKLTVFNPSRTLLWPGGLNDAVDPAMNQNLQLVRVQYRPVSGGEWITAKSEDSDEQDKKKNLLCGDSRTEGCKFSWNVNNQYEKLLSGYKDGTYELRVKNFCFGGSALAESSVHEYVSDQILTLTVDTKQPLPLKKDEEYSARTVTLVYDEAIDCTAHSVAISKVFNSECESTKGLVQPLSLAEIVSAFNVKCSNANGVGSWTLEYPESTDRFRGVFEVVVSDVADANGNVARNDVKFRYTTLREDDGLTPRKCGEKTQAQTLPQKTQAQTLPLLGQLHRRAKQFSSNATALAAIVIGVAFAGIVYSRRRRLFADNDGVEIAATTVSSSLKIFDSDSKSYGATV
jgi:hypothetical protein